MPVCSFCHVVLGDWPLYLAHWRAQHKKRPQPAVLAHVTATVRCLRTRNLNLFRHNDPLVAAVKARLELCLSEVEDAAKRYNNVDNNVRDKADAIKYGKMTDEERNRHMAVMLRKILESYYLRWMTEEMLSLTEDKVLADYDHFKLVRARNFVMMLLIIMGGGNRADVLSNMRVQRAPRER